jgi:hypothetical protein
VNFAPTVVLARERGLGSRIEGGPGEWGFFEGGQVVCSQPSRRTHCPAHGGALSSPAPADPATPFRPSAKPLAGLGRNATRRVILAPPLARRQGL